MSVEVNNGYSLNSVLIDISSSSQFQEIFPGIEEREALLTGVAMFAGGGERTGDYLELAVGEVGYCIFTSQNRLFMFRRTDAVRGSAKIAHPGVCFLSSPDGSAMKANKVARLTLNLDEENPVRWVSCVRKELRAVDAVRSALLKLGKEDLLPFVQANPMLVDLEAEEPSFVTFKYTCNAHNCFVLEKGDKVDHRITNSADVMKIILLSAKGIQAVHLAGFAHRDCNLGNFLVQKNEQGRITAVTLIDFEFAILQKERGNPASDLSTLAENIETILAEEKQGSPLQLQVLHRTLLLQCVTKLRDAIHPMNAGQFVHWLSEQLSKCEIDEPSAIDAVELGEIDEGKVAEPEDGLALAGFSKVFVDVPIVKEGGEPIEAKIKVAAVRQDGFTLKVKARGESRRIGFAAGTSRKEVLTQLSKIID